ncbi:MAG: hypothetical protein SGARI_001878 [Bacillariaceae sp.]
MISSSRRFLMAVILSLSSVSAYLNVGDVLWEDNFNEGSTPDIGYWSFDIGDGCAVGNCGWGNQELQYYTSNPENVNVVDGNLNIIARRVGDTNSFTSSRIKTQDKVFVKYGTIEARIQIPDLVEGLWPAFWTLGADFSSMGWPACGETDILEMGAGSAIRDGMGNQRITSGAHWSKTDGTLAAYAEHPDYPYSQVAGVDSLATYVINDDASVEDFKVWEMDIDLAVCPDCTEFHQEHFLILNLAVGGKYTTVSPEGDSSSSSSSSASSSSSSCESSSSPGGTDNSSSGNSGGCEFPAREDITAPLPATMKVDWVRVVQNGHSEVRVPSDEAKQETLVPTKSPTKAPVSTPAPTDNVFDPVNTPYPTEVPRPADTSFPTRSPVAPVPKDSTDVESTPDPTSEVWDDDDDYYFSADLPDSGSGDDDDDGGKSGKSGKGGKSGKSGKSSKSSKASSGDVRLSSSELLSAAAVPTASTAFRMVTAAALVGMLL